MMDATIKGANNEISGAASKVRSACGSGEEELTELSLSGIVDASVKRIRARALGHAPGVALLEDDAGQPLRMAVDELQEFVRMAGAWSFFFWFLRSMPSGEHRAATTDRRGPSRRSR